MLAGTGLSLKDFVCFSRLLSLITQILSEEWLLNHENDLEDCNALTVLSTAWFITRHKIRET